MGNFLRCTFFIVSVLLLIACDPPEPSVTVEDLVQQKLQQKITDLHKNRRERCINEALESASLIVDSILIERARLEKDSLAKPPKPTKPEFPDVFILQDTTSAVRPLFQDSIQ